MFEEGNKIGNRFQPGKSGNPNGRPKGVKSFKERILAMAEREISLEDIDGKMCKTTLGEAVALTLYGKAVKNKDLNAIRMVMEHTEDKALTLKGDPNNPLEINQTVINARGTISEVLKLAASARASSRTFEDELGEESPEETNNS
jgi:hypothetical protein